MIPTVQIRIDLGGKDGVPHTFLAVTHPDGRQIEYGLVPAEHLSASGPGKIDITGTHSALEEPHEYDFGGPIQQLTDEQYNNFMEDINKAIDNPPPYILPGNWWPGSGDNCTGWAVGTWQNAGLPTQAGFTTQGTWNPYGQAIWVGINNGFNSARTWIASLYDDPLALDLDGLNGIETTGIQGAATVLFDTDGDGIKTGTGWVKGNDGLVVWDRNCNGLIDTGSELFGTETVLANGQKAKDGFAALRDLDTNTDGRFDAVDAQFTQVRIWRDQNQDGVSQAEELKALAEHGIASINLNATAGTVNLANGNQSIAVSTYTLTDGTVRNAAAFNLASTHFYREFSDTAALSEQVKILPDMQGSGMVRDLRQAAGLAPELASVLSDYAAATTRDGQRTKLDALLDTWANTSGMKTTSSGAFAGHALTVTFAGIASGSPEYDAWMRKLSILERFNGQTLAPVPAGTGAVSIGISAEQMNLLDQSYTALKDSIYTALAAQTRLTPYLDAIAFNMDAAGISLDFAALMTKLDTLEQTDVKNALIDLVELDRFAGNPLRSSGWDVTQKLRAWVEEFAGNADSQSVFKEMGIVIGSGSLVGSAKADHVLGRSGNDSLSGQDGSDLLSGGAGTDSLSGGNDNDLLLGDADADNLYGGAGADMLDGGIGNDTLDAGIGSDIYLFNRGFGQDVINNNYLDFDTDSYYSIPYYRYNDVSTKIDTIRFGADIAPADISVQRSGDHLVLSLNGTTDQVKVANYFYNQADNKFQVERIEFADGTAWTVDQVKKMALIGTANADMLTGYASDDLIEAGAGNDYASGGAGADTINGGNGTDRLYGQDGNDFLSGGAEADTLSGDNGDDMLMGDADADALSGGAGHDTLDGGTGNDTLDAGIGSDIYLFNRGFGQDVINNNYLDFDTDSYYSIPYYRYNDVSTKIDTIRFGADIAPADISVQRSGDHLILSLNGTTDQIKVTNYFYNQADNKFQIERIEFADSTVWDFPTIKNLLFAGTSSADTLTGFSTNDVINGGLGNDTLSGGAGVDILQGGADADTLSDSGGNCLLNGGADADTLIGSASHDFFIGGAGNDTITTGTGFDVIAFNRGDGQDVVNASTGKDNTLSLGKGIQYADLLFKKSGNDLVLVTGTSEQVTFKDWYLNVNNHSVANLQIVIEGTSDYDAGSGNALNNRKIEQFDFDALATKFDQARAIDPGLTGWALSPALLEFHLNSSDTAAFGGDLAYQYAMNGNLSNVSVTPAQALLESSLFGTANQDLQIVGVLQDASPLLA